MSPARLTSADIAAAAARISCPVSHVHAVLMVETGGAGGFLADGRPRILFEAHLFSRMTRGRWDRSHPAISSPSWNRSLYKGGAAEYGRLEQAAQLDEPAARMAASWGLFQVLGQNFGLCRFSTVFEFCAAHALNEGAHLDAFLSFCQATGCDDELQRGDWAGFARIYNGPGYAANAYDVKLARAAADAERDHTPPGELSQAPAIGAAAAESMPDVVLRIGQRGTSVSILQTRINARGFGPLTVDGVFGRVTELAVERFQAASGLVVDGIVGPKTLSALGFKESR